MACTGNQSTISNGLAWAGTITRIGGVSINREALNNSDLSTGSSDPVGERYATYCQGDLLDTDPLDIDLLWDSTVANLPPIEDIERTWTITRPDSSTIVGTGFIVNSTSGDLVNNELQEGSMQLKFSGSLSFGPPA